MKYYFYYYKRHSNLKIKINLSDGKTEISTGIKLKESEVQLLKQEPQDIKWLY
tara:strand:+ start:195 stop:353 length:159 start_codon:yes stop_codon:yes gene_type:complete